MSRLHVPLYLDEPGIAGLYAQTVDRLEDEVTKSFGSQNQKKGLLRAGLGGLITKLIGGVEVEGEVTVLRESMEQAKLTMSIEHKLTALLAYLDAAEAEPYFTDVAQAISYSADGGKPFVRLGHRFGVPQFSHGRGAAEVNEDGALLFEATVTPDDRTRPIGKLVMVASLENCVQVRDGHLRNLSHLAIILREVGKAGVSLDLFGIMRPLVNDAFQIKPFAIWL